jgi:addiction module RelE/StbE family toxin
MQIDYSDQSIDDLSKIGEYIAQNSKNRAVEFLKKLKNKIELLIHFPFIGMECESKGIYEDCRVMIFESYLIFYAIKKESIRINRILHHSVNYQEKPL